MTTTVSDTIDRQVISGVGPYAYSFRIFSESELTVRVDTGDLDPVLLTLTTHYSIDGVDDEDGGTITLVADVASLYAGDTIDIRSNTVEYQPTSIRNQGRFLPEVHEIAFDRLSRQIQDLRRQVNQKFGYPDSTSLSAAMDLRSTWADKWVYVNSDGEIEPAAAISPQALTQTIIGQLLNPATAEESAVPVTIVDASLEPGHIDRYGGDGTGVLDSTAALQAAFDSVRATGDAVRLGRGVYKIMGTVTTGPIDNKKTTLIGNGGVLKQYTSGVNTLNVRNSRVQIIDVEFANDAGVAASNSVAAIDVLDVSDISITDCVFNELKTKGIALRVDASAVCTDFSIKGNHFNKCCGTSISANSEDAATFVRRVAIVGNTFESPTSPVSNQIRAIHLVANVTDVTIQGNVCSGTALADYTQGWRDCFMVGNSSATEQPSRVTITGNVITGMGDDGVGISGATHVTVTGNIIHTSLVTSGVYVPGSGTWFNDQVVVADNVIYTCELAGIFLKDTKSYTISGNLIYNCQDGIYVNDNGVGILRGTIHGNTIHTVERRGIYWDGGVCSCTGNVIDDFGDSGSVTESDKAAIFLNDTVAGSVISGNVIKSGIHGFVITGNGTQFIVSNNVVRSSNTGYGALFIAFTGGTFLITNNILSAATAAFSGAPAVSATAVRSGNVPQLDALTFTQSLATASTLTPAQITANQNDYNPTGWLTSLYVRLSSDISRNITGFARDGTNMIKIIRNVGAQNIVLTHQDAASTANQRIICPGAASFTIGAGSGAWLIYDGTADRWSVIAIP